ncbi:hypothetical protein AQULUS_07130 [Aquicella lusitana]|uniref:Uncharacterized protein n=1 Tax=Aquicella lusitana TaxID=254246 RepID=A0A370GN18_9COXI|nr:hypothetical protein C8D86_10842 [Aquicella lusitana]VVC72987.1 hypothetical protein AQULUS_07130 [Aquicella lusitana]
MPGIWAIKAPRPGINKDKNKIGIHESLILMAAFCHPEQSFVILSEAKDLLMCKRRSFASLRMTAL